MFQEELHDYTVEAGSVAVLTCRVCGRPRPTVTWRGPDQAVMVSSRSVKIVYAEDGTASLQVNFPEQPLYLVILAPCVPLM